MSATQSQTNRRHKTYKCHRRRYWEWQTIEKSVWRGGKNLEISEVSTDITCMSQSCARASYIMFLLQVQVSLHCYLQCSCLSWILLHPPAWWPMPFQSSSSAASLSQIHKLADHHILLSSNACCEAGWALSHIGDLTSHHPLGLDDDFDFALVILSQYGFDFASSIMDKEPLNLTLHCSFERYQGIGFNSVSSNLQGPWTWLCIIHPWMFTVTHWSVVCSPVCHLLTFSNRRPTHILSEKVRISSVFPPYYWSAVSADDHFNIPREYKVVTDTSIHPMYVLSFCWQL